MSAKWAYEQAAAVEQSRQAAPPSAHSSLKQSCSSSIEAIKLIALVCETKVNRKISPGARLQCNITKAQRGVCLILVSIILYIY